MLLRYATPAKNLPGILRRGLLCRKSQGRLPVVWLHAPSKSAWAMLHTVKRHGGRIEAVAVIELTNKQTESREFSKEDEALAGELTHFIWRHLCLLRARQLALQFRPQLVHAQSVADIHEVVLQIAVQLLEADRGDLVTWDPDKQSLVVQKSVGKLVKPFDRLPEKCIIRTVWDTGQP